jgi:6-pyruvoyltetrahydropterin/6-carboxytetrahydropterin synthase
MPYRVCKSFEIENGHMLSKHPDKCRFPHGHTRRVECVLRADTLDGNEMVCDFKVVKELLRDFLDAYDHALCINTDDPQYAHFKAVYGERVIGFAHRDPTTEVLAQAVFEHLAERLSAYVRGAQTSYPVRAGVTLERVRVWETSSSWAEYWPALP